MKEVDLVMWTKNGERTLPSVLARINKVVPSNMINRKIMVDDDSTDYTREIGEDLFGWRVVPNNGKGISDGANTALENVEADYFISFEQDLLLAENWFREVPPYIFEERTAIASGTRFASQPVGLRKLQEYVAEKYIGENSLPSWLRSRQASAFTLGKTLDNTIYNTRVLRDIGGFPKLKSTVGLDTYLAYKLYDLGYYWRVNYNVRSLHLRHSLQQELEHQQWHTGQTRELQKLLLAPPVTVAGQLSRFALSPFTGLFIAWKQREPSIAYIHPLIRFYNLKGLFGTTRNNLRSFFHRKPRLCS